MSPEGAEISINVLKRSQSTQLKTLCLKIKNICWCGAAVKRAEQFSPAAPGDIWRYKHMRRIKGIISLDLLRRFWSFLSTIQTTGGLFWLPWTSQLAEQACNVFQTGADILKLSILFYHMFFSSECLLSDWRLADIFKLI